jgi:hypothetical protein
MPFSVSTAHSFLSILKVEEDLIGNQDMVWFV